MREHPSKTFGRAVPRNKLSKSKIFPDGRNFDNVLLKIYLLDGNCWAANLRIYPRTF